MSDEFCSFTDAISPTFLGYLSHGFLICECGNRKNMQAELRDLF